MRSVRLRLLVGAACAIAAALLLSWLILVLLFDRHLQRNVEEDLIRHGQQIAATLQATEQGLTVDPEAAGDLRFNRPASGLYWEVAQGERLIRSRSLWDEALIAPPAAPSDDWARGPMEGPFGQQLISVNRSLRAEENGEPVILVVGLDRAGIIEARSAFAAELALFLFLLWAALSTAAWIQVRIGLKPLRTVETSISELTSSPASRLQPEAFPKEVIPLVEQINTLAETREADLRAARDRAANLAHALKTPLSALSALARKVRASGDGNLADGLDASIRTASETVERELARARTAASVERGPCEAAPVLERLAEVLRRTESGAKLDILIHGRPDVLLPVHADQLFELAGPLMENAVRYAQRKVVITAESSGLSVEDDGPGLGSGNRELLVLRGQRADETSVGHGLGLAIASDLAEATGGRLELHTSELGGLLVRVRW